MGKIYQNIEELIGRTPLLEVAGIEKELGLLAKILVKLEYLNVGGMGMKAGRSKLYKNIAASDEEREVFRELRQMELMMKVQVVPTEKAEDLGKYL